MKISEQVAELEKQAQEATTRAEQHIIGLRAGVRGDVMTETDPDGVMDRGWREGKRLRKIARVDLEGFRAGVLGETYGDGADPAFVAGYAEGEKVRAEAAVAMWEKIDAANRRALTEALGVEWGSGRSVEEGIRRLSSLEKSWQARCVRGEAESPSAPKSAAPALPPIRDGYYLVRDVPGYTDPLHVAVTDGVVWGYSILNDVANYQTIGRSVKEWAVAGMKWEPEGAQYEGAMRMAPTVRVGGYPPAPEIGMVYRNGDYALMVNALPWTWPSGLTEIRAPWGGPVVWRRD